MTKSKPITAYFALPESFTGGGIDVLTETFCLSVRGIAERDDATAQTVAMR
jgi:hypothetical protein